MKHMMDVLIEILIVSIVMLTQGTLVATLVLLGLLLVVPEHPLIVRCLKFLKGLV